MNLKYRNQRNAEATAKYWNKPLDRPDWYKVNALSDDETEIILYDVIGWPFNDAGEFVRMLSDLKSNSLTVRINSPGGDVFDAMSIYNALQSHPSKVTTRVESLAASAASFISLAGKNRQAYQNAMYMIHEPWAIMAGNQFDFRDVADVLGMISDNMVDIYADNSNVGKRGWKEILAKGETWFKAKEAKEKGMVDTIVDGKAAKAQFDLSMFDHVPDEFMGEGREVTEREKERVLRDVVGLSAKEAKAFLAGRRGDHGLDEIKAELEKTLNIFGGK